MSSVSACHVVSSQQPLTGGSFLRICWLLKIFLYILLECQLGYLRKHSVVLASVILLVRGPLMLVLVQLQGKGIFFLLFVTLRC